MSLYKRQLNSQSAVRRLTVEGQRKLEAAKEELRDVRAEFPLLEEIRLLVNSHTRRRRGMHKIEDGVHILEISSWMLDSQPVEEVLATIRHEYAHALTAGQESNAHGPRWRAAADDLGVPRKREARNQFKWVAECPNHGILNAGWYSKPQPRICAKCREECRLVETSSLANPEALQ